MEKFDGLDVRRPLGLIRRGRSRAAASRVEYAILLILFYTSLYKRCVNMLIHIVHAPYISFTFADRPHFFSRAHSAYPST